MMFKLFYVFIFCIFFVTSDAYSLDPPAAVTASNNNSNINLSIPELSPSVLKLILVVTLLGIAPSVLMMVTSFTRVVVVLSILRNAIGLQQSPPNVVIISLSLFLTFFIMTPTLQKAYDEGFSPWSAGDINETQALELMAAPFHGFMLKHTDTNDLAMFVELARITDIATPEDTPYRVLVPAFMIGELRRAFEIGFLLFLPFLIIDLLVASVLMTMGMMMMPPVVVALPFKIIFFVLIDGWRVLSEALVKSFDFIPS